MKTSNVTFIMDKPSGMCIPPGNILYSLKSSPNSIFNEINALELYNFNTSESLLVETKETQKKLLEHIPGIIINKSGFMQLSYDENEKLTYKSIDIWMNGNSDISGEYISPSKILSASMINKLLMRISSLKHLETNNLPKTNHYILNSKNCNQINSNYGATNLEMLLNDLNSLSNKDIDKNIGKGAKSNLPQNFSITFK